MCDNFERIIHSCDISTTKLKMIFLRNIIYPQICSIKIYDCKNTLFFSTGESHDEIKKSFRKINVKSNTFVSSELLYDLKTAISYTICLLSDTFISHTYSTFSSLITMQRELMYKNTKNYSYDNISIYKRLDKGLNYKKVIKTNKNAKTYVEIVDNLDK